MRDRWRLEWEHVTTQWRLNPGQPLRAETARVRRPQQVPRAHNSDDSIAGSILKTLKALQLAFIVPDVNVQCLSPTHDNTADDATSAQGGDGFEEGRAEAESKSRRIDDVMGEVWSKPTCGGSNEQSCCF